jgi:hypothetical protein
MVANAEWLVAAHRDELIRDAEQARLMRRCRAPKGEGAGPAHRQIGKPATDMGRHCGNQYEDGAYVIGSEIALSRSWAVGLGQRLP